MKQKLTFAVVVSVVLMATPIAMADHEEEPREFTYINQSGVDHGLNTPWQAFCEENTGEECPVPIFSGFMSTVCDHSPGWAWIGEPGVEPDNLPEGDPLTEGDPLVVTPWQGVGGAIFCNVPKGAEITVEIDDAFSPLELTAVTCPFEDAEQVVIHRSLNHPDPADADPEFTGTVPDWCESLPSLAGATGVSSDCEVRLVGIGAACEPEHEYDEDDGPYNYCDDELESPDETDHEAGSVYCAHPNWESNTEIGAFNRGPPDAVKTTGTTTLEISL